MHVVWEENLSINKQSNDIKNGLLQKDFSLVQKLHMLNVVIQLIFYSKDF